MYNRYNDIEKFITDYNELKLDNGSQIYISSLTDYDIVVDLEDKIDEFEKLKPFIVFVARNICKLDNITQRFNKMCLKGNSQFPYDLEIVYISEPNIIKLTYWGMVENTEFDVEFNVLFEHKNNEFLLKSFGTLEDIPLDWDNEFYGDEEYMRENLQKETLIVSEISTYSPIKRELFLCLIAITLFGVMLSFGLLAIPSSRFYVLILAIITIAVGVSFNFKKWSKVGFIWLISVIGIYCSAVLIDPRERRQEYKSPMGLNTIIIEYDHASRPSIYRKENVLFMTPILFDFGPGYNETVSHEISWLSENKVKLTDHYGQEWIVDLNPES